MDLRNLTKACFLRRLAGMSAPVLLCAALAAAAAPALAETSTSLEVEREKNRHGLYSKETFVDRDGNPVMADDMLYCYAEHEYSRLPARIRTTFHDVDGNHVNTAYGYATIEYKWSGYGWFLEERYKDLDGNLVMCENGYAEQKRTYQGVHLKSISYYDTEGRLCRQRGYWAQMVNTIDTETGYTTKVEYFDEYGNYALCEEGWAYVEREYKRKQLVKEIYYDTEGHPVYVESAGYARYEVKMDKLDRITEIAYFDESDALIDMSEGYARMVKTYDKSDDRPAAQPISEEYFDAKEQRVNCSKGYARVEYDYDANDRMIETRYYDMNGDPVACAEGYWRYKTAYTMHGEQGYERYYGTDGKLMMMPDKGYASVEYIYENKSYLAKEIYYDENGDEVIAANGYSRIEYTYELVPKKYKRFLKLKEFKDPKGNAVYAIKEGCAQISYELSLIHI